MKKILAFIFEGERWLKVSLATYKESFINKDKMFLDIFDQLEN